MSGEDFFSVFLVTVFFVQKTVKCRQPLPTAALGDPLANHQQTTGKPPIVNYCHQECHLCKLLSHHAFPVSEPARPLTEQA
jgi:hypothetical protein